MQPLHVPSILFQKKTVSEFNNITIVEQEIFTTGNLRNFRPKAISVQEIFANFWLGELTLVILACRKFSQNSQKFPAHENLLFYSIFTGDSSMVDNPKLLNLEMT